MPSRTPTRRALLLGGTAALTVSAGCISDLDSGSEPGSDSGSDSNDSETENDDESTNETETDEDAADEETDADDAFEYEVQQYEYPETPTDPDVSLLLGADDADEWLAARGLDGDSVDEFGDEDATDADGDDDGDADADADTDSETGIDPGAAIESITREFVDETDFESASLIALEADAPNLCYEMVVDDVTFEPTESDDGDDSDESTEGSEDSEDSDADTETNDTDAVTDPAERDPADGTLSISAVVSDESEDDEMCAQALTTVGVLVRASVDGRPVTNLSASIVDSDGGEFGSGVASASETDSASDSASDTASDSASDGDDSE